MTNNKKKSIPMAQRWLEDDIDPSAITVEKREEAPKQNKLFIQGGPGSGGFGHRGRPGQVGGSSKEGGEGMITVAGGFEDPEYRGKLREAVGHVNVSKDITVRKDISKGKRFATVGDRSHYEIYIDPETTRDKSVGFISAVVKHESIHLEQPNLSESEVRRMTLDWAKERFELDENEVSLLSRIE
jgi:hypothetical protein